MMIEVTNEKKYINQIVDIHLQAFEGFFLSFLGKGFLKQLYLGFISNENSNIIITLEGDKVIGFLAYSQDMSSFYKYLIKRKLILFAWYALLAFFRNPRILFRLLGAFRKSDEVKRKEAYIEIASIGVSPLEKGKHIGTKMINCLKDNTDFNTFQYISLETDSVDNEYTNKFYKKNGFKIHRVYKTREGREMNEYRYMLEREKNHERYNHLV